MSQALKHHFDSGGRRTRARLTSQFARDLDIIDSSALILSCIVESLHKTSLIHDDLQDQDEFRRGHESVWKKYGPDMAICAGYFLISASYACLGRLEKFDVRMIHHYIHSAIKGQNNDLSQKNYLNSLDINAYESVCRKNSGPPLAMGLFYCDAGINFLLTSFSTIMIYIACLKTPHMLLINYKRQNQ